ncbi:hypothetical protein ZWY2020_022712 [Hordeum vulgare]|nr:hypothetical protein ZWY2020_051613 [Hordeum vulgare]KAI4982220.1 hypothetical protein ZWY2020_022712 [Hordeum vulgare]
MPDGLARARTKTAWPTDTWGPPTRAPTRQPPAAAAVVTAACPARKQTERDPPPPMARGPAVAAPPHVGERSDEPPGSSAQLRGTAGDVCVDAWGVVWMWTGSSMG